MIIIQKVNRRERKKKKKKEGMETQQLYKQRPTSKDSNKGAYSKEEDNKAQVKLIKHYGN